MKNHIKTLIFLSTICAFSLCSCGGSGNSEGSSESDTKSPLIFSEFLKGTSSSDRAIEITSISEEEINLSDYVIKIFHGDETTPSYEIKPEGKLTYQQTYVIAYPGAAQEILDKANLVTTSLMIDGSWPLGLYKGDKLVDVLGIIGYQLYYGFELDLVRKKEYFIGRDNYISYDWIRYSHNHFSSLGNIDTTFTNDELLEGPRLTQDDFDKPFATSSLMGSGGAIEVTLGSLGDGDTTYFRFPNTLGEYEVSTYESVRYQGINTPETQHGTSIEAQPWGYAAKTYNNNLLKSAKHIVIQTMDRHALRETFGRMLGYVWYTTVEDPKPEDYINLNFMMVKDGYSFLHFPNEDQKLDYMEYKGVNYSNIMKNAEILAENLGIKVHGEIDPNFNY